MQIQHRALLAALPIAAIALTAFVVQEKDEEAELIRHAVQFYIDGHATGKRQVMEQAFHPSARLQSINNGEVAIRSIEQYLSGLRGQPASDETERKRKITFIDYHGTAAIARVELDYPSATFVDYMQLLKVGDEWKIVNKIYHVERK
jgi:hypothetical protein